MDEQGASSSVELDGECMTLHESCCLPVSIYVQY